MTRSGERQEREGDPRLMAYMDALQDGRVTDCMKLRETYSHDEPLLRRFGTVEQQIGNLTRLYMREIQIQRREIRGWRNVATGLEILEGGEVAKRNMAQNKVRSGRQQLKSAEALRERHEVVEVPNLENDTDEEV